MLSVAAVCVVVVMCPPSNPPPQQPPPQKPPSHKPTPKPPAQTFPPDFVGMVANSTSLELYRANPMLDRMVKQGVGTVRFEINWRGAQPYPKMSKVPKKQRSGYVKEGGVPTSYWNSDRLVGAMAQRHLDMLPVVVDAPKWDEAKTNGQIFVHPPQKFGPYAHYFKLLVRRYGPKGKFWSENPKIPYRPIRQWQIWNEPDIRLFWRVQPWDKLYVQMSKAAHKDIKHVDPGAEIVMGGLSRYSWSVLASLYKIGGVGVWDAIAVHPFTRHVKDVVGILRKVRKTMKQYGEGGKPLLATELSWPSAKGKTTIGQDIAVTKQQQAKNLTAVFKLLAKNRKSLHLQAAYWFTWLTYDKAHDNHFDYAGVLHLNADGTIKQKPAYKALGKVALGLDGCKAKAGLADACSP